MSRDASSPLLLSFERTLLVLGVVCLAWYGWTTLRIHRLQSELRLTVEQMLIERPPRAHVAPTPTLSPTSVIGQMDIPRIHLSAVVMEGDDDRVLDVAIGHLADTPPPWHAGNSAFAAHRDGLFRPLKGIRVGDTISLTTSRGDFQYRVRQTLVVNPADVWVLAPIPRVSLTLITCFPFTYIGRAPERFIVQAEKVESAAP